MDFLYFDSIYGKKLFRLINIVRNRGGFFIGVSTIVARVYDIDKIKFNEFCDYVWLNASFALNLFIKTVIRENRIFFPICRKPDQFYGRTNQDSVSQAVQERRTRTSRELIDVVMHKILS